MAIVDVTFQDDFRRVNSGDTVNLWNDIDIVEPFPPIRGENVTLNGRGHTLRGLIRPLFADETVVSPTVTNLNVCVEFTRNAIGGEDEWGGLFRAARGATLRGVSVMAKIRSTHDLVGGIAGVLIASTLERCAARGIVSAYSNVGGIAGLIVDSKLIQCHNEAKVTAAGEIAGGIAGRADGASVIEGCVNFRNASVTGAMIDTGGIVGLTSDPCVVRCCRNRADISGANATGGIVGGTMGLLGGVCEITRCVNTGAVRGAYNAGGIVGMATGGGLISNNDNGGDVSAVYDYAGGIAGEAHPIVYAIELKNNRVNRGWISARNFAHRVVGYNTSGLVMTGNTADPSVLITATNAADSQTYDKQRVRDDDPQLGGWLLHGMTCALRCPNGACWDNEDAPPTRVCLCCP
ncbi:MAG: hypothetical protein LBH66_05825 [Oscillospiraceae bacterium]|jgi:hypothetical protein|nr:hypothetical protein [Oscillospiraceae bacterium]